MVIGFNFEQSRVLGFLFRFAFFCLDIELDLIGVDAHCLHLADQLLRYTIGDCYLDLLRLTFLQQPLCIFKLSD